MNKCPSCGEDSSFVPERMECDGSLVLWCKECGDMVNQTLTVENLRRWHLLYDEGEQSVAPPIDKEGFRLLKEVEDYLNRKNSGKMLENIKIHIQDFDSYYYTEEEKDAEQEI